MHPAYPPKTIPCAIPKKIHREFLSFFWGIFFGYRIFLGEVIKIFALNIP